MKTLGIAVAILSCGLCVQLSADPPAAPDPLECLIGSSTLIVDGDITDENSIGDEASGVAIAEHYVGVHCREVIVGKAPGSDIAVCISRVDYHGEGPRPYHHKGSHCIFFLREFPGLPHGFRGVDLWFSVQPYSATLVDEIKRIKYPPKQPA